MGLRGGGGHVEKDRRKWGMMNKKWRQTRKTTKRLKKPYNWHSMLTIILCLLQKNWVNLWKL